MPFQTLIGVDDLAARLGGNDIVVIDCRFTLSDPPAGEAAYRRSRLPGARYAHLERDLSGPKNPERGRNPLPDPGLFAATLTAWGISPTTQIVVYDDSFGSIACRLWWLLRRGGHRAAALLDGGWPLWKRKNLPIENTPPTPPSPASGLPYPLADADDWLADTAMVEAIRGDAGWALLDARPEERYTGERETVDAVGGHIPGSHHATFEDNLDYDGTFLSGDELRERFATLTGSRPPSRVVHTCGSGVTACHNVLAMEHAGLPGSRLYAGSWSAWIADPERSVARGAD